MSRASLGLVVCVALWAVTVAVIIYGPTVLG